MNAEETVRYNLKERGIEYDERVSRGETVFLLNYNRYCGDYTDSISVIGECVTYSKHYMSPESAVFLAFISSQGK